MEVFLVEQKKEKKMGTQKEGRKNQRKTKLNSHTKLRIKICLVQ